jgi:aminocarboxymuconate-semialdehyde decarboxylase
MGDGEASPLPAKRRAEAGPNEPNDLNPPPIRYKVRLAMQNRRHFFKTIAGAAAGTFALRRGFVDAAGWLQAQAPARRQVSIGGRRVRVIDVHGHCAVPMGDTLKGTPLEKSAPATTGNLIIGADRVRWLDEQGIDVQVLTQQGAWWYGAPDRDLARQIVKIQNEKTAEWCKAYPDRLVALASVSLQFPDLAAEQLEDGVKRLGMRGGAIAAGSVPGKELSARDFDPFWAKAQELGVLLFMHPSGNTGTGDPHFGGRGNLGNTIGNPLETTMFLSHLIFDGTLDRFPRLRICAAHAGGYLPSYLGRTDAACTRVSEQCSEKKRPADAYFKEQLLVDTMIFREEGLRHLVAEVGTNQIVYGTDYPFPWPVNVDFILRAPFLNDSQREAILGGTLAKLLRITT